MARAKPASSSAMDPMFLRLRGEAEEALRREPDLGGLIYGAVLAQDSLESVIGHRLAQRLDRRKRLIQSFVRPSPNMWPAPRR